MENSRPVQGLYDIYDLIDVPFWETKGFLIALTLLVVGALLIGVWQYFKGRKNPILTPWEEALLELERLNPDEHSTHLFYEQLTIITKKYIACRYNYSLSEKTDEEIVLFPLDIGLPEATQQQLKEIFSRAVGYKFAKQQASQQQMINDALVVQSLIKQTTPQEKGN